MEPLRQVVNRAVGPGQNVELEIRYGAFVRSSFQPGVPRSVFYSLLTRLLASAEPTVSQAIDVTGPEGIRRSWNLETQAESWMRKEQLKTSDLVQYGVRVSASLESNVPAVPGTVMQFSRQKVRYSFPWRGGAYRLDMTVVSGLSQEARADLGYANIPTVAEPIFEIEAELLDKTAFAAVLDVLEEVYQLIYETPVMYDAEDRALMFHTVNGLLGGRPSRDRLDSELPVQARDLHFRDMVWGGLVGNDRTQYMVTHKADGQRAFLVNLESGVWLVSAPFTARLVTRNSIPNMLGTVLDGELVGKDKRRKGAPSSELWYLPFDCLAYESDVSIQDQAYVERMAAAQSFADAWLQQEPDSTVLTCTTKSSYLLDFARLDNLPTSDQERIDQFYMVMRRMFAEQDLLAYEQDGFVFTPAQAPYNPRSNKVPLNKRVLTQYADVCKWKPVEQMTIDFYLNEAGELFTQHRGQMELWRGSAKNPWTGRVKKSEDIPADVVIEFAYDRNADALVAIRPRFDKSLPNGTEIADDNWDWIFDPITRGVLEGREMNLVFKFHNRVKSALLDAVGKYWSGYASERLNLLDIGSGRGGDVWKWKSRFGKVVAVEPNAEHRKELAARLEKAGMTDRVLIVAAGGEQTDVIWKAVESFFGGRADAATSMLSLSFFWQNAAMLDGLAKTLDRCLKPDGVFAYLTVDGTLVQELFSPAFRGPIVKEWIMSEEWLPEPGKKGEIEPPAASERTGILRYDGKKRELFVDMPGTIVSRQTEWLVYVPDLASRIGAQIIEYHRTDTEPFLSRKELIFNKMYAAGLLSRIGQAEQPIALPPPPSAGSASRPKPAVSAFPWLPVQTPSPATEPGVGDDQVERLAVDWFEDLVRIATIGDGSCYVHALLKATSPRYQEEPSYKYRVDFVARLRRDLAALLTQPTETPATAEDFENREKLGYWPTDRPIDFPQKIVYEAVSDGNLVSAYKQTRLIPGEPIDLSLEGLQTLFNSSDYLGDEVYGYFSEMLQLDVIVTEARWVQYPGSDKRFELNYVTDTIQPGRDWPIVVVMGNKEHFEPLAVVKDDYYQTVFPASSLRDEGSLPATVKRMSVSRNA